MKINKIGIFLFLLFTLSISSKKVLHREKLSKTTNNNSAKKALDPINILSDFNFIENDSKMVDPVPETIKEESPGQIKEKNINNDSKDQKVKLQRPIKTYVASKELMNDLSKYGNDSDYKLYIISKNDMNNMINKIKKNPQLYQDFRKPEIIKRLIIDDYDRNDNADDEIYDNQKKSKKRKGKKYSPARHKSNDSNKKNNINNNKYKNNHKNSRRKNNEYVIASFSKDSIKYLSEFFPNIVFTNSNVEISGYTYKYNIDNHQTIDNSDKYSLLADLKEPLDFLEILDGLTILNPRISNDIKKASVFSKQTPHMNIDSKNNKAILNNNNKNLIGFGNSNSEVTISESNQRENTLALGQIASNTDENNQFIQNNLHNSPNQMQKNKQQQSNKNFGLKINSWENRNLKPFNNIIDVENPKDNKLKNSNINENSIRQNNNKVKITKNSENNTIKADLGEINIDLPKSSDINKNGETSISIQIPLDEIANTIDQKSN